MNRFLFIFGILGLSILTFEACGPDTENKDPQYIIDQAFKAHGSKVFDQSIIEFRIGKRNYKSTRENGEYRYERFWDSLGVTLHDDLTRRGITRHFDQTQALLDTKKIDELSSSIRNLFFLFSIPFGLNEPQIIKEYLGEVILVEKPYHKIRISFKLNPNDRTIYDNEFVLWIHKTRFTIDYLSFKLSEPNDKSLRFRQAVNPRKVEGLLIQDFKEFKPIQDSIEIAPADLDQAWIGKQLQEWSGIKLEQVKIRVK